MTTERRILEGAAELFYERGFHGVSVDQIGERVGSSGSSLYHYFNSKDEILAALFYEAVEELIAGTAPLHDDPRQDLDRLVRHHINFAISRRQLVNVYEREEKSLVEPWKRHFRRRERIYSARWVYGSATETPHRRISLPVLKRRSGWSTPWPTGHMRAPGLVGSTN